MTSARVVISAEPQSESRPQPASGQSADIGQGIVAFIGVERGDGPDDVEYIARKIRELRMFESLPESAAQGPEPRPKASGFDRSVGDVDGEVLVVSQFTLAADCRKGRRPAFDDAAPPEIARPLYEAVVIELRRHGVAVATGQFQAMMQVTLTNDGPVTLLLDSRKRF